MSRSNQHRKANTKNQSRSSKQPFDLSSNYIKHPVNKRADAAWVLYQILENGRSASEVMPKVWERFEDAKDRAWLQEMVYGSLRNLPKLQVWLRQLLDKPLKKQQKIVEHLIMIGLYQLTYSRTAEHAAVSETVEACKQMKELGLSGLVNAVLRRFQRENIDQQSFEQEHVNLGLSKWLYKALLAHYSDTEHVEDIAKNMHQRAPLWLRINTLKTDINDYIERLDSANIEYERHSNTTIKLVRAGEITKLPGYDEGLFAVQDYAAQQAARFLAVQKNDIVLDCCAAPGGKSASVLESQANLAQLYMIDADEKRNKRIEENLQRLGHSEYFGEKLHLITQDASELHSNDTLPMFDRILLDAPCSATGVIRRHPDIMWLRKSSDIAVLVELQAKILQSAWQKLRPGGTLLYATCSILPQENQQQIEHFLAQHNDATLVPITTTCNQETDTWQILPGQDDMDGFFYAKLVKAHDK
jgi:16S rRNA (cytosine967-C5)-methyltransferase